MSVNVISDNPTSDATNSPPLITKSSSFWIPSSSMSSSGPVNLYQLKIYLLGLDILM